MNTALAIGSLASVDTAATIELSGLTETGDPVDLVDPNDLREARRHELPGQPGGGHGALPEGERHELWSTLMSCAADGEAPEVQAIAGVLATAFASHGKRHLPLVGLGAADTRRLMARWFPGADMTLELDWRALAEAHRHEPRSDEIEELVGLLTEAADADLAAGADLASKRADPSWRTETRWLAHALSQASLGDNHLWQDLHLPSRRELSSLMSRWFSLLAARNHRDMKWKKFLYKQLCDRAGINACRAPSCSVCSDYATCFGPEDAVAA
jgi:nitrogen fixation protein NifQ